MLAGADGYKKRWIVAFDLGDGTTRIELVEAFAGLTAWRDLDLIVIDVPIGLPDAGSRSCDRGARAKIGPRRNSVFSAPIRPMLHATSYEEACTLRYRVEGKRCSRQLYGILPLIRGVDERMSPMLQERIREGHPEVSFTALGGAPMRRHKATTDGQAQRRRLLQAQFPDLNERVEAFGRPGAITDILDAYALLWSARQVHRGDARRLPESPEVDARGLRMEMVY